MVGLAAMVEAVLAGRGVHFHATDGIKHARSFVGVMIVAAVAMAGVIVVGMIVSAAACTFVGGRLCLICCG